jgi:hypothetical protein
MPEHRGDGAGPGSDGRCGRDAVHAAHGVRGGGLGVVGRRRGEELFRRGNLSSDSVGSLALALPYEGRFLSVFWVRPHTRGCPSRCFRSRTVLTTVAKWFVQIARGTVDEVYRFGPLRDA